MKRYKNILSEVAEPKPAEEKKFKDQHEVEIYDPLGIGDMEAVKPKKMPIKRLGDYMKGQDETAYDQAYTKKESLEDSQEELTDILVENPAEEVPMMIGQLRFIEYAANQIEEWLTDGMVDPEEWYQNKLAATHSDMKTMYAYAKGRLNQYDDDEDEMDDMISDLAAGYGYTYEELQAEEAEQIQEISRSMTPMRNKFGGTVIPKKFDAYKKFVKKNNVDEPTVRMIHDNPDAAESKRMMKNPKIAQAVDLYKDAHMKESVEQIDEMVKAGTMKLKDGSSIKVSKQDASLLAKMFKELNSRNRKEMEKVLVKDKAGFEEIVGFAREAL
jgi:hypothetical protein